jgi:ABC-2 type transport system permease protein
MLLAAIKKDSQLLLRDRGALITMFLLPIVFIAVFGTIFGGGGGDDRRKLAVWAADAPRPAAVMGALEASRQFELVRAADADAVRQAVADGDVLAGLILPADFDPAADRPAELAIDQALAPQVRFPLEGMVAGVVARAVFPPAPGSDRPVFVATTPPGVRRELRDVTGFQITVPGNAVLFGFYLALTVGLAFAEERRQGTWRRLLAAPVPRATILLAKLVPYLIMGLIQFAFLFGVGIVAFGMKVGGSPLALAVLTVAVVTCAVCLGLVFAAIGGSERAMGSIGSVTLLVMGMVGGCMVPRLVMPPIMRTLGLAVPHSWSLDGYFVLLVRDGAGLADVAPQIGALFGFAALFAAIGVWRFRFEKA